MNTIEQLKSKISEAGISEQDQGDYLLVFQKLQVQKTELAAKLNLVVTK